MKRYDYTAQQFLLGQPACPIACKYCFITEHESRRAIWNQGYIVGINKASTFINIPPWIDEAPVIQRQFVQFPWQLLRGDIVGFTAITDPLWPKLRSYFDYFVEQTQGIAKIITAVTKWPLSKATIQRLAEIPNFYLVLAITGNEGIEKVSVARHLKTLAWAQEYGLPMLPISHPYISGHSDLSFLPELYKLGYRKFDVKGFRYDHTNMQFWLRPESRELYQAHQETEYLPEDGWREQVAAAGLELCSPKNWYLQAAAELGPRIKQAEARSLVLQTLEYAAIVSSAKLSQEIVTAAINRRIIGVSSKFK